jgi:hypothetical protein
MAHATVSENALGSRADRPIHDTVNLLAAACCCSFKFPTDYVQDFARKDKTSAFVIGYKK